MTLKNYEKSEEQLTCYFKNWHKQFDEFWLGHWKVSKIYTLMGCSWLKYIMFKLKKYRGVIFHDARKWCQIEEKVTCGLKNDMKNLENFHQSTQVSKLGLLLGLFIQSRKCTSLKFTRVLCVMTIKNDTQFEKEWTCLFKIDMRNLTNFDLSIRKSQKFAL